MPATTPNLALRYPTGTDQPDGAGALYNLAQDIEDRFGRTAGAVGTLAAGTRYGQRAVVGGTEYRWKGTSWQPWDSEWQQYTFAIEGLTGTANPSDTNGWTFNYAQYRYSGGKIRCRFEFYLVGPSPTCTGQINVNLPVAMATGSLPSFNGRALKSGGNEYWIDGSIGGSKLYTSFQSTAGQMIATTYNQPFTWGVYDIMRALWEYDPV